MPKTERNEYYRLEDQLVAVVLKVNKTTDGAVRGWYHIVKKSKI